MLDYAQRNVRQLSLINGEALHATPVIVVGCGAIGSHVGRNLAQLGSKIVRLCDPDVVNPENMGIQGFREKVGQDATDLGLPKVEALARMMREFNPGIQVETAQGLFDDAVLKGLPAPPAIFCCVDSIDARAEIYRCVPDRLGLWLDGRMGLRNWEVYAADSTEADAYFDTLFPQAEQAQLACTEVGTCALANMPGLVMLSLFTNWLNGCRIKELNLPVSVTGEMFSCTARSSYLDELQAATAAAGKTSAEQDAKPATRKSKRPHPVG